MAPVDAADLSHVHAQTWEATYVGQVPDDLAHRRIAQARNRNWSEHAELRAKLGGGVLVLADQAEIVGFCEFGPTDECAHLIWPHLGP